MARAVLAVWAPLAVGFTTGQRDLGLLPAFGGQLSIMQRRLSRRAGRIRTGDLRDPNAAR
jgi:hypothetical protein